MADRQPRVKSEVRVVSHHPRRQALLVTGVLLICLVGALAAFWLGRSTANLDLVYMTSLERLNQSHRGIIAGLEAELLEQGLTSDVDRNAAASLRDDIRELRDQVASLNEEVTFYKSLMAPSSVARGLQIADFELNPTDRADQFNFHLLLTQVESRRDWVQGDATLEVHGRMTGSDKATVDAERVLSLTDLAADGSYPLKFRFRYFQDLTGLITLPPGFEPDRVVVQAGKRGATSEALSRTFEWTVAS